MKEEEAYWLGFLFADGSLHHNRIDLRISAKDKDHAEKFASYIGAPCIEYNVFLNGKTYKAVRVGKSDKKYSDYFNSFGIIKNKTKLQKSCPINLIEDKMKHHWLRGFFDGDGCISFKPSGQPVVSYCCFSKEILEDIKKYMRDSIPLSDVKIIKDCGSYKLRWGGSKQVSKVKDLLYADATIMLDRKKQKFNKITIIQKEKLSKFIGVSPSRSKWQSRIKVNGKTVYLGSFITELEAAKAYDIKAKTLGKKTNFGD